MLLSLSSKIIDKNDVIEYCQMQNPNFDAAKVPNIIIKLVNAQVLSRMRKNDFEPADEDLTDYSLWACALCYCLEWVAKAGEIHLFTGDVQRDSLGKSTVEFQRWQPMFFFANGAAEKFYDLLPHKTFEMLGNEFFHAWIFNKTRKWSFVEFGRQNEDGNHEIMVGNAETAPTFLDTYYMMVKEYVQTVPEDTSDSA